MSLAMLLPEQRAELETQDSELRHSWIWCWSR